MPKYRLKLFGRFELLGPDGLIELPNKKLAGLLAYLACGAPEPQSRERLSTLLWGSHFEAQARQNLRQVLFRLRRILGPESLVGDGDEVALDPAAVDSDVARLKALRARADPAAFADAANLYAAPLLADVNIPEEAWAEWLGTERSRLENLALDLMILHAEHALRSGEAETALRTAHRAIDANALREDAHRLVVQSLAATGRKAEALKHYRDLVALLRRELNVEPDGITRSLAAELRDTEPVIAPAKPAPISAREALEVLPAGATASPSFAGGKPSLVALPFRNMSGDPEQEYFTDGVTEDIIAALSRFRELVVMSRSSSFVFKGKRLTNQQIARELDVRYVLSGSVRRAGSRLRVFAELIDGESGVQLWSDRYDRALVDVFDLQDDISRSVAAVVVPALRGAEIDRAQRKPAANLSAYDLYLQALPRLWAGTRADLNKAVELLRQSLDFDQTHAPTLAALAWGLVMTSPLGADSSSNATVEAVGLARRAVEADNTDAFAQAVYGFTLFGPMGQNDQGRVHSLEAVRLNPNSAFAWGTLGMIGSMRGDYEHAIECLERSLALSPHDTLRHFWMTGLTASCFALGRHEEGVAWARQSVQHSPGNGTGYRMLAANLAAAGQLDQARDVTRVRDAVQKTTIRELRAMRYFKQEDVLERYLSAQRSVGVAE